MIRTCGSSTSTATDSVIFSSPRRTRSTYYPSLARFGFDAPDRASESDRRRSRARGHLCRQHEGDLLADMSGDGLSDIVRIRNGEICYWPNLGYGNFGAKVTMDEAPWFDAPDRFEPARIRLGDIDGSGVSDVIYLAADGVRLVLQSIRKRVGHADPGHGVPARQRSRGSRSAGSHGQWDRVPRLEFIFAGS